MFSGQETETFFSKGKIRITPGRFFELIEEAGAAPAFRERVHAKRADQNFWGLVTLGSLAVGVGGLSLGYSTSFSRGMGAVSTMTTYLGMGGLATAAVSSLVWTIKAGGPDYTWEQANDAVVDYHKRLDTPAKP